MREAVSLESISLFASKLLMGKECILLIEPGSCCGDV